MGRTVVCAAAWILTVLSSVPVTAQSELVIAKEGSGEYHRPDCSVVRDGKGVIALSRAQAESRGLKPHAACDPATATASKPAEPVTVFVDRGRYYHRESCKRLAKDSRKIQLDEVARKYWPCPACKPPIRRRPAKQP